MPGTIFKSLNNFHNYSKWKAIFDTIKRNANTIHDRSRKSDTRFKLPNTFLSGYKKSPEGKSHNSWPKELPIPIGSYYIISVTNF